MRVTEQQTLNQQKTWTDSLTISHYSNQILEFSVELGQHFKLSCSLYYFFHLNSLFVFISFYSFICIKYTTIIKITETSFIERDNSNFLVSQFFGHRNVQMQLDYYCEHTMDSLSGRGK